MEKIHAFGCGFCAKIYRQKNTTINHEKKCYFNPETRSCATCQHLVRDQEPTCSSGILLNRRLRTQCAQHQVTAEFEG